MPPFEKDPNRIERLGRDVLEICPKTNQVLCRYGNEKEAALAIISRSEGQYNVCNKLDSVLYWLDLVLQGKRKTFRDHHYKFDPNQQPVLDNACKDDDKKDQKQSAKFSVFRTSILQPHQVIRHFDSLEKIVDDIEKTRARKNQRQICKKEIREGVKKALKGEGRAKYYEGWRYIFEQDFEYVYEGEIKIDVACQTDISLNKCEDVAWPFENTKEDMDTMNESIATTEECHTDANDKGSKDGNSKKRSHTKAALNASKYEREIVEWCPESGRIIRRYASKAILVAALLKKYPEKSEMAVYQGVRLALQSKTKKYIKINYWYADDLE